jgi:prepilin-type N-terminal cleavage/methylation domain-containing protein
MNIFRNQRGFTFVELVIAMALSSFLMIVLTSGIIQLYRIYQSGQGIRATQQNARFVAEELSRDIRDSGGFLVGASSNPTITVGGAPVTLHHDAICVVQSYAKTGTIPRVGLPDLDAANGNLILYYVKPRTGNMFDVYRQDIGQKAISIDPATNSFAEVGGSCAPGSGSEQRLSNDDASIAQFSVAPPTSAHPELVNFTMSFVSSTAHDDEINYSDPTNVRCRDGAGSQYCSMTQLTSSAATQAGVSQ